MARGDEGRQPRYMQEKAMLSVCGGEDCFLRSSGKFCRESRAYSVRRLLEANGVVFKRFSRERSLLYDLQFEIGFN